MDSYIYFLQHVYIYMDMDMDTDMGMNIYLRKTLRCVSLKNRFLFILK